VDIELPRPRGAASIAFRSDGSPTPIPTTKNPAYFAVSRVEEILRSIRYLITFPLSKCDPGVCP
jgi:hypothetical protein